MNRQFRQCNNLGQRLSASLFVVRFHDPRLFRYVSLWARSHFSFAFLVDLFRSSFYRRIFWSSENSTISRHIRLSSCWWFLTINSANKSQTIRNQMRPDNMDKMKERMIFKPKNTIVMWTYRWNLGEGERKKNSIRNHRQKPNKNATQAQHPQEQMEYRTGCRLKRKMKSESKIYSLAWTPVNLQKSKSTNHHLTFQTSTFNFICLDFLFHPVKHQTSCRSFNKKCPITKGVIQMSVSRKYCRTKPLVKKRFWNQFCWK